MQHFIYVIKYICNITDGISKQMLIRRCFYSPFYLRYFIWKWIFTYYVQKQKRLIAITDVTITDIIMTRYDHMHPTL